MAYFADGSDILNFKWEQLEPPRADSQKFVEAAVTGYQFECVSNLFLFCADASLKMTSPAPWTVQSFRTVVAGFKANDFFFEPALLAVK